MSDESLVERVGEYLQEMSLSARINTVFSLIMIPMLLIWSGSLLHSANQVNEINAEQIEQCMALKCEANMWGQLVCTETDLRGNTTPPGGGLTGALPTGNFSTNYSDPGR